MKKVAKIFCILLLFVGFPIISFTCESTDKTIAGFEFAEMQVDIEYGENFDLDQFGTKILYVDGTSQNLSDFENEIEGLIITIQKENSETGEYEDWNNFSQFAVGHYLVTYSYGECSSSVFFNVKKTDYSASVPTNFTSQMTWGENLSQPSVQFDESLIENVKYYYQEYIENNSYSNECFEYNYEEDIPCEILPGNYQIYAVIETENYNNIITSLQNFEVKQSRKTNYDFFTRISIWNDEEQKNEYNYSAWEYDTDVCNVTYQFGNIMLSDYLNQIENIYICEVDDDGEVKLNENGEVVFAESLNVLACWAQSSSLVLNQSNNVEVLSSGEYIATFSFSQDVDVYETVPLDNLKIKIVVNKLKVNIPTPIAVYVDSQNTAESVEYDGAEHHLANFGNDYIFYSGQYYATTTYNSNGTEQIAKIYHILNFSQTDAGNYQVVCTLLPEWENLLVLAYANVNLETEILEENIGISFDIGSWTISKKNFAKVDADVFYNNKTIDEYIYYNERTFVYNKNYDVTCQNIKIYNSIDDSQPNNDIAATFQRVSVLYYNGDEYLPATDGISVEDNTIIICSNCKYTTIYINLEFSLNNNNYQNICKMYPVKLKEGIKYTGEVYGTIENKDDSFKLQYIFTNAEVDGVENYYVSTNEETYSKWENIYNILYFDADSINKVINTSIIIDWTKTYYIKIGSNYHSVSFYYAECVKDQRVGQFNNTVGYDGKNKTVKDAGIALLNIEVENFSNVYNSLYVLNNEYEYVINTSNVIQWDKIYYNKTDEGTYQVVYFYRRIGNGYLLVDNAVDSIEEYYVSLFSNLIDGPVLQKLNEKLQWIDIDCANEPGSYRIIYSSIILDGKSILVNSDGEYVEEVIYRFFIVDNLTKVSIIDMTISFEDESGNTIFSKGSADYGAYRGLSEIPPIQSVNGLISPVVTITLDTNVNYEIKYLTVRTATINQENCITYYYQTKAYIVFDRDYCLIDMDYEVIDCIEIGWSIVFYKTGIK